MRCSELLRLLDDPSPAPLARVYASASPDRRRDRRQAWQRVARRFLELWGDREAFAFRAPGRIALNPHCEHQGAWNPYGAHQRELLCLAAARADDTVTLSNLDPSHQSPLSFRLGEEVAVAPAAWERGWLPYIEDLAVARRREALADPKARRQHRTGSINFIKAAALRLARDLPTLPAGADLVIEGDIPVGVGQSSSSALVVAAALACNRLWSLGLAPKQLVSLCGEAEWYVGTRGGAGDHAAMLLGSPRGLMGIRFVPPVSVRETRPMALPAGCQLLIANSSHKAIKNKEERRLFNAGIFAYRFALLYLRQAVAACQGDLDLPVRPQDVRFLADVSAEHFSPHDIYRLLLAVPETVSPAELLERYPDSFEPNAVACFGAADPDQLPPHIPIRGAALYGLGRVDRGLAMHDLCARGDEAAMAEFGRLMYITHDGDRVTSYDLRARRHEPYTANRASVSDAEIAKLLAAAQGRPPAEQPQLRHLSGYYGASVPELDRIVDVAASLPDVLGAGLMGAGGGGCVLILARDGEEARARITTALAHHYYDPLHKPVDVDRWSPSAPAAELPLA